MKKFILTAAIFSLTISVFAANTSTDPFEGKKAAAKKESTKNAAKKYAGKTLLCQVVEVKDENNNTSVMAIFAETGAKTSANTYLNYTFFADVKVIAEAVAVDNYEELVAQLKGRYAGIKILGAAN